VFSAVILGLGLLGDADVDPGMVRSEGREVDPKMVVPSRCGN
jgi:hypothetical protein